MFFVSECFALEAEGLVDFCLRKDFLNTSIKWVEDELELERRLRPPAKGCRNAKDLLKTP